MHPEALDIFWIFCIITATTDLTPKLRIEEKDTDFRQKSYSNIRILC